MIKDSKVLIVKRIGIPKQKIIFVLTVTIYILNTTIFFCPKIPVVLFSFINRKHFHSQRLKYFSLNKHD